MHVQAHFFLDSTHCQIGTPVFLRIYSKLPHHLQGTCGSGGAAIAHDLWVSCSTTNFLKQPEAKILYFLLVVFELLVL